MSTIHPRIVAFVSTFCLPLAALAAAPLSMAYLQDHLKADDADGIVVAKVGEENVTLREIAAALSRSHASHDAEPTADTKKLGKIDFAPVIERAISARLISVEARDMGLDQTPEFKKAIEEYRTTALIESMQGQVTGPLKADPADVERVYKDLVREWKIRSLLATKKEDADKAVAQLKAGKTVEAIAKQLLADKKGQGGAPADFLPRDKLFPSVESTLARLKKNEWSAPVQIPGGFAIVRWEDERFPDNAASRSRAESMVLASVRKAALTKYYAEMVKRYAKVDAKLLDSIDFESKEPGLEKLKKDERVIAEFQGGDKITVANVAATVEESFFHGLERAVSEKKANLQKYQAFDALVSRKVVPLEEARLHIADSADFKQRMKDHVNGSLFSKYMEMVVVPSLKLDEAAAKSYFTRHEKDFTYPAFYTVESLAFTNVKDAQAALTKLQAKTDLKWLTANADGQVKQADRKFEVSGTLSANGIPADLAKVLSTAKKDDFRLWEAPEKQYYVIHVIEVTPSKVQPFEEARDTVKERLLPEAIELALKDQTAKLRKAHPVTLYVEQPKP